VHILNELGAPGNKYHVIVGPLFHRVFEKTMKLLEIVYEVIVDDLQKCVIKSQINYIYKTIPPLQIDR